MQRRGRCRNSPRGGAGPVRPRRGALASGVARRAPGSRSRSGSDEGNGSQFTAHRVAATGRRNANGNPRVRAGMGLSPRYPSIDDDSIARMTRLPLARAARARAASAPPAHRGEGTCEHAFGEDRGEPARKDAEKGVEHPALARRELGQLGRLLSGRRGNSTAGSNPALSARKGRQNWGSLFARHTARHRAGA